MALQQRTYNGIVAAIEEFRDAADAICDLEILDDDERDTNIRTAISNFGKAMDEISGAGGDLAQLAFTHGMTKKAIAEAWGIPASTFAGMKKEA
jgi:hypothetical protein